MRKITLMIGAVICSQMLHATENNDKLFSVKALNISCSAMDKAINKKDRVNFGAETLFDAARLLQRKDSTVMLSAYRDAFNKSSTSIFGGDITQASVFEKTTAVSKSTTPGDISISLLKFWSHIKYKKTEKEFNLSRYIFLAVRYHSRGNISNVEFKDTADSLKQLGILEPEKSSLAIDELVSPTLEGMANLNLGKLYDQYLIADIIINPKDKENYKSPEFKEFFALIIEGNYEEAYVLLRTAPFFIENSNAFIKSCEQSVIVLKNAGYIK